jgi:hypothetical protein
MVAQADLSFRVQARSTSRMYCHAITGWPSGLKDNSVSSPLHDGRKDRLLGHWLLPIMNHAKHSVLYVWL